MAATDIISKKTRQELVEHMSANLVLRQITQAFDAADVAHDDQYVPPGPGQRRSLAQQFLHSLDFTKQSDARKFLKVCEDLLNASEQQGSPFAQEFPKWLRKDGFGYENGRVSSSSHVIALDGVRAIAQEFDAAHMQEHVARMSAAVDSDPAQAIGSSKELIETCCKTILKERGKPAEGGEDLLELVKAVRRELKLLPDDVPSASKGADTVKRLLSNLGTIAQGLAELRSLYGTGHGREGRTRGVQARHARLAVGVSAALAQFLFDTHKERGA